MARKKETKEWYVKTRFTMRARLDPKWEKDILREPGKSFAQKLDNSLAKIYAAKKKATRGS